MKKYRSNYCEHKNLKRFTSLVVAFVMIMVSLPMNELSMVPDLLRSRFFASADEENPDFIWNNLESILHFSQNYKDHAEEYSKAVITFYTTDGSISTEEFNKQFESIGTEQNPFEGRIEIGGDLNLSHKLKLTKPFFAYLDVKAQICDPVDGRDGFLKRIDLVSSGNNNNVIFAEHITNKYGQTTPINLELSLKSCDTEEVDDNNNPIYRTYNFGGFIGELAGNATLTISDGTESGIEISSPDNAGLVCRTMNDSSSLTVDFKNINTQNTITAANGSAGAFVGSMGAYSTLNVINDTNSNINISSVSGKNAGGYVGSMGANAKVVIDLKGKNFKCSNVTANGGNANDGTANDGNAGGIAGSIAPRTVFGTESEPEYDISVVNSGSATSELQSTITGKNAGGLVGSGKDNRISLGTGNISIKGNIEGTENAGGVYGVYENSTQKEIDFSEYTIGCTLKGGNAGGIYGTLKNTKDALLIKNTGDNDNLKPTFNVEANKNYGGAIGKYFCDSISKELEISGVTVKPVISGNNGSFFGGFIGHIDATEDASAVYVKFSGVNTSVSGSNQSNLKFGGLIGNTGNKGSFIDIRDAAIDAEFYGGGLVHTAPNGVIRLSGTTDMTKAKPNSGGQLVASREQTLIYSIGNGSDSKWSFKRNPARLPIDDIGNWGEVVRLSGSPLNRYDEDHPNGIIAEDLGNHIVTVKAPVTTISTVHDFAKTALNIQLNNGINNAESSLRFDNTTGAAPLLSGNLTISGNIDLAGTGITGLTRDDGDNPVFSGEASAVKLSGDDHDTLKKISLAIGEPYGMREAEVDGEITDIVVEDSFAGSEGAGRIYTHSHNGLFAKTGKAAFENIEIGGNIYLETKAAMYAGGASAYQDAGNISFDNVKISENIELVADDINGECCIGGALGVVSSAENTVNVSDCTIEPVIKSAINGGSKLLSSFAGKAYSKSTFDVSGTTIGGSINVSGNYGLIGGLIAESFGTGKSGNSYLNNTVTLKDNTISLKITSDISSSTERKSVGGLLGFDWVYTDVEFLNEDDEEYGINVNGAEISAKDTGKNYGVFAAKASGHWTIGSNGINFSDLKFYGSNANTSANVSSLSMLINQGSTDKDVSVYLELTANENGCYDNYKLGDGANIKINNDAVFDEFIAFNYTFGEGKQVNVCSNGNPVISIPAMITNSKGEKVYKLSMDSSGCNSYQNRAKVNGEKWSDPNSNIRYYYNVDKYVDKNSNPPLSPSAPNSKIFVWSVHQYAASNIKSYFTGGSVPNSDNDIEIDLDGFSYYPVDVKKITVKNATFNFGNEKIEAGEASSNGGSDGLSRTTKAGGDQSQHYLMHCGLFRNVSEELTAQNITLQGTIGKAGDGSGALVCGKVEGKDTNDNDIHNNVTLTNITLDGIRIPGVGTDTNSGPEYAPLLINRIASFADITVKTVINSEKGYITDDNEDTILAATSLLSVVGAGDAKKIKLSFSDIVLDGRKPDEYHVLSALDDFYHTTHSIFTNATLLEALAYSDNDSSEGKYQFTHDDDWNSDGTGKHRVTYGWELYDADDNSSAFNISWSDKEQNKYYGDSRYVDPESSSGTTKYFSLSATPSNNDNFLHYVNSSSSLVTNNKRELKVNHHSANLENGCGTYNDPYVIETSGQLDSLAASSSENFNEGLVVKLPAETDNKFKDLCGDDHVSYRYNDDNDTFYKIGENGADDTTVTKSKKDVKEYLAQAYYVIDNSRIELSEGWAGIGNGYYFTGVIIGKKQGEVSPVIVNNAENETGFIVNSNGCVLKDITVELGKDPKFSQIRKELTQKFGTSPQAYGAVINQIHGGDNIFDNVTVNYNSHTFKSDENYFTVPVGGYVGVIVNGGLFFKNMAQNVSGLPAAPENKIGDDDYYYQNPYIGRVINGFAVYEDDSAITETSKFGKTTALDNGSKNYIITTLKTSDADKLSVNGTSISIPDAQAMFVLSAITQSGAGKSTGYGAAHIADYSHVGESITVPDEGETGDENYRDYVRSLSSMPRLIEKFVSDNSKTSFNTIFDGGNKTGQAYGFELTENGSYDLSSTGFRGINGMFNDYNIKVKSFNGNSSHIKLGMNIKTLGKDHDNYHLAEESSNHGVGLFNCVHFAPSDENESTLSQDDPTSFRDLTLHGSVIYDEKNRDYSRIGGFGTEGATDTEIGTGGLIGRVHVDADKWLELINVDTDDGFHVFGVTNVGGLVGKMNENSDLSKYKRATGDGDYIGNQDEFKYNLFIYDCEAAGINVEGFRYVGGILGYKPNCGTIVVRGKEGRSVINVDKIHGELVNTNDGQIIDDGLGYACKRNNAKALGGEHCFGGLFGLLGRKDEAEASENGKGEAAKCEYKGIINNNTEWIYGPAYQSSNKIILSDYTVKGKGDDSRIGTSTRYTINGNKLDDYLSSTNNRYGMVVGAICGSWYTKDTGSEIKNFTYEDLTLVGGECGGIAGSMGRINTGEAVLTVENFTGNNITMFVDQQAGGVIGMLRYNMKAELNNVKMKNVTMHRKSNTYGANFGALLGMARNSGQFNIRNIEVEGYELVIGYVGADAMRCGTLMGSIYENSANCKGYNVLIKDVEMILNKDNSYKSQLHKAIGGEFKGSLSDGYIQIVGCQISNFNAYTYGSKNAKEYSSSFKTLNQNNEYTGLKPYALTDEYPVPTGNNKNPQNSYIIYADFGLSCLDEKKANTDLPVIKPNGQSNYTSSVNGVGEVNDMVKDFKTPILNLNPVNSLTRKEEDSQGIVYEPDLDENGIPKLDDNGEPILKQKVVPANDFFMLTGDGVASPDVREAFLNSDELYVNAMNTPNPNYNPVKDPRKTINIKDWFKEEVKVGDKTEPGKYSSKFSTISSELPNYKGKDNFPVVIVDDKSNANTLIEYYIKLLTNYTNFEMKGFTNKENEDIKDSDNNNPLDNTNYCLTRKVEINKKDQILYKLSVTQYKYDEDGGWVRGDQPALRIKEYTENNKTSYMFTMDANHVDITDNSFSLIDVAFMSPLNREKVAYHLYIPVFVKKLLKYDVKLALNEGTDYEYINYIKDEKIGVPLACNTGSIVTACIDYDYSKDPNNANDTKRELKDWDDAIQTGDDFNADLGKSVLFTLNRPLPDGTQLVLIDKADAGKAYYLKIQNTVENGVAKVKNAELPSGDGIKYKQESANTYEYEIAFSAFADPDGNPASTTKLWQLLQQQVLSGNAELSVEKSDNAAVDTEYVVPEGTEKGTVYAPVPGDPDTWQWYRLFDSTKDSREDDSKIYKATPHKAC